MRFSSCVCQKRRDLCKYTRACAKEREREGESGVRMRDILARNESWAARHGAGMENERNIMEHITNTRWSADAAHTKRGGDSVDFACFSLFRCQLGIMAAQSKHEARARRKSTCSRIIWGIMLRGGDGSANAIKLEPHFAVEFARRQLWSSQSDSQCKSRRLQIQLVCRCAYSDGNWLWDMENRNTPGLARRF